MKNNLIYLLAAILCISCNPEEIGPQSDLDFLAGNPQGVLISNEGNFNFGNASLSFYNPFSHETSHQIYKQVNGEDLGDVLQDVVISEERIYLVLNNSNKIVVTDKNLKKVVEIQDLESPRYLGIVNNQKGYVTDLYADEIAVVNLNDGSKTGAIPCVGWTENIFIKSEFAYAINKTQNAIYKIDIASDQVVVSGSLDCLSVLSIAEGDADEIYVLVESYLGSEGYSILNFSLSTMLVTAITYLPNHPLSVPKSLSLGIDVNGDTFLSYYDLGIQKLIKNGDSWDNPELIWPSAIDAYGLDWNDEAKEFYVSDPINFVQSGNVYRVSGAGDLIDVIDAGSIPNGVSFND